MSPLSLLSRPARFFRDRPSALSAGSAFVVVLAVALVTTLAFLAVGRLFASELTGTVTVDNPNHVPEWACDVHGSESSTVSHLDGCDQPAEIEREAGTLFQNSWSEFTIYVPIGIVITWLLYGAFLHVASALFDGRGSFFRTLAVAGWSMIVLAVVSVLLTIALAVVLPVVGVPDDPEALADWLESPAVRFTAVSVGALLSLWQGYVWYGGLQHARRLEPPDAALAAGLVVVVDVLWQLLT